MSDAGYLKAITEMSDQWLNRLAKWRSLLAGWQLGSRPKGDPEADAVRDHREVTLMLRAEVNAITQILLTKRVMTREEWAVALINEAQELDESLSKRFPGVASTDDGLSMTAEAAKTMATWNN